MDNNDLDEIFRALAHKERRMFLDACLKERRAAGDLAERSNLSLATVSEHLKVLRKTGLVTLEKTGRFWFYQTDRSRLRAAIEALKALEKG
jgi:DNA-binding transcriptional ArsR family regulator